MGFIHSFIHVFIHPVIRVYSIAPVCAYQY